jgi:hypothetical protein
MQVSHRWAPVDEVMRVTERYVSAMRAGLQSTFMPGTARTAGSTGDEV